MKIPIYGTGLSGLVGSRITDLLQDKYEFTDLSLTTGIDITNYPQVEKSIAESSCEVIIHMAAKTDVDACEDDKILGEEGGCWQINVEGTKNIVEAAKKYHKKVVYISTDFVFDGTKECYSETDTPNPVNWYGFCKFEGESAVIASGLNHAIVRLAYPYRASYDTKPDFIRKIVSFASKNKKISALCDHVITPTLIDDIAWAIDLLIEKNLNGIYHIVGSSSHTPFEAAKMIIKSYNLDCIVEPVLRENYFKGRAFRPFKLVLKNDKITGLGIEMKSLPDGLKYIIKSQ